VAPSNRLEYRRKVRIMTRGLRGVAVRRDLLDPRRTGFYAVQLASHKVLRRLMAFPLIAIALTAPLLWADGVVYRLTTLCGAAVAGLGAVGLAAPATRLGRHRLASLPAFFVLVNVASLHAAWNLATGRRIDRWEPRRGYADRAGESVDERAAGDRRAIRGAVRDPVDETVAGVGR
jgi:hypothetical protein